MGGLNVKEINAEDALSKKSKPVIKCEAATTDPGVNDDNTQGWEVNDLWTNTTTDKTFVAQDVSTGAAVWTLLARTKTIDLTFPPHNGDYKKTASSTYEIAARHTYSGSNAIGAPTKIYANAWIQSDGGGNVRIYDLTNALVIAESANITSVSGSNIVDLGSIANVPSGQAVWLIEWKNSGGTKEIYISSLSMEF